MLDALVPGGLARPAQPWTAAPARRGRRGGRTPRSRRRGHHPDARDEGPGVLSRRAQHRPPGPRGDVVALLLDVLAGVVADADPVA